MTQNLVFSICENFVILNKVVPQVFIYKNYLPDGFGLTQEFFTNLGVLECLLLDFDLSLLSLLHMSRGDSFILKLLSDSVLTEWSRSLAFIRGIPDLLVSFFSWAGWNYIKKNSFDSCAFLSMAFWILLFNEFENRKFQYRKV